MPTLTVHLAVAMEASALAGSEILSRHMGDLYLGSTSPDVRNLVGIPREDTHYVGLNSEEAGDWGVGRFLQSHGAAADLAKLSDGAKSFVAGYLSHLATDGTWIVEIYRPYFGMGSALAEIPNSNMLDRALQFELEERERRRLGRLEAMSAIISQAEGFTGLGLMADDELRRWREFIGGALRIEDVGQRFRYFASSFTRDGRIMPTNRIDGFVTAFPALVARVLQHVPESSLAGFRQKAIDASAAVLNEYLSGDLQALMRR